MQCSVTLERDNSGSVTMKMINNYKNPYRKESNLDNIVDQLCTRLQDIKDQEGASRVGMPTGPIEQAEAVRRYYAAFPALKKGQESPLQYYLPPPAWCRKSAPETKTKMQSELSVVKDWNSKNKKSSSGKERRNSYHGQRRNHKKRNNIYSRSFESKDSLPEWVTHEGVWEMETQDPVKDFIRAIAMDEGYGTCENTVTDEIKEITQAKVRTTDNVVPDLDDSLDLDTEWVITEDLIPKERTPMEEELYAKFEAKFDRSIEALWSKDQNTPDDEYQDLPIDFQDLLSSPSDHLFADPSAEKCSLISLTESIWSSEGAERFETASRAAEALPDRFKPLNLADGAPRAPEPFALYEGDDLYDALSCVAHTLSSFAAINHSRERSAFAEVPPRRASRTAARVDRPAPLAPAPAVLVDESPDDDDPFTSARTHFRPVRREPDADVGTRYADGDTFDIKGDLDPVQFRRSDSGGLYLESSLERYLEYRGARGAERGRVRCRLEPETVSDGLRLRFAVRQNDVAVQTEPEAGAGGAWAECEECGRAAKKMRPNGMESIWSEGGACAACGGGAVPGGGGGAAPGVAEELSREWEELVSAISAAHAAYAAAEATSGADRKRRHSAALRCAVGVPTCTHPHARFLPCCTALAADRPLTR